jgi:hypothetical protein
MTNKKPVSTVCACKPNTCEISRHTVLPCSFCVQECLCWQPIMTTTPPLADNAWDGGMRSLVDGRLYVHTAP